MQPRVAEGRCQLRNFSPLAGIAHPAGRQGIRHRAPEILECGEPDGIDRRTVRDPTQPVSAEDQTVSTCRSLFGHVGDNFGDRTSVHRVEVGVRPAAQGIDLAVFVRELCSGYVIVVAGRIVEFQYHRKASLRLDENQYATVVEYVPVDGVHRVIDIFPEVRPQVGSCQIEHNGLVRRFGDRRAGSDPFVLVAAREKGRCECKDKHYMM